MGMFTNPLSHAGYPPGVTGTPTTQPTEVRAATIAEANAGTLGNVYISPLSLAGFSTTASFASPPVLGFGSTTPRPVHATTLSSLGATTLNTSGAATTTIGTGGTGAVQIGNATGNTAVTGSLTASTTLTATLGAITATNGNLVLGTAGNKITIATGANASAGTTGALTAGAIVVSTTAITANSLVFFATHTLGTVTVPQAYRVSARTPGTSFTIQSQDATDTSTVDWVIIN